MRAPDKPVMAAALSRTRLCMGVSSLALLVVLFLSHDTSLAAERAPAMPNGTWVIDTKSPADVVEFCREYLPAGTKLQLRVGGPTRRAIEEDLDDELGGTLRLLSPVTDAICRTGIGAETGPSPNLCSEGRPDPDAQAEFDDAIFVFSRLDEHGVADVTNGFFVQRGAKVGSRFVSLLLKHKGIQWDLWLRSPDEMLSKGVYDGPGKENFKIFPLIWRRIAE